MLARLVRNRGAKLTEQEKRIELRKQRRRRLMDRN